MQPPCAPAHLSVGWCVVRDSTMSPRSWRIGHACHGRCDCRPMPPAAGSDRPPMRRRPPSTARACRTDDGNRERRRPTPTRRNPTCPRPLLTIFGHATKIDCRSRHNHFAGGPPQFGIFQVVSGCLLQIWMAGIPNNTRKMQSMVSIFLVFVILSGSWWQFAINNH